MSKTTRQASNEREGEQWEAMGAMGAMEAVEPKWVNPCIFYSLNYKKNDGERGGDRVELRTSRQAGR